ncbi:hypothetical protein KM043_017790 [Ampulex compressa]|nr:hypothetical protein KM043_017790 [Ampulex compressa]
MPTGLTSKKALDVARSLGWLGGERRGGGAEEHLLFAVLEAILVILVTAALAVEAPRRNSERGAGQGREETIKRKEEAENVDERRSWRRWTEKEEDTVVETGRRRTERRVDRHWRRSNNGLLAMIIEHEAAGAPRAVGKEPSSDYPEAWNVSGNFLIYEPLHYLTLQGARDTMRFPYLPQNVGVERDPFSPWPLVPRCQTTRSGLCEDIKAVTDRISRTLQEQPRPGMGRS